jgi:hypothetical protein
MLIKVATPSMNFGAFETKPAKSVAAPKAPAKKEQKAVAVAPKSPSRPKTAPKPAVAAKLPVEAEGADDDEAPKEPPKRIYGAMSRAEIDKYAEKFAEDEMVDSIEPGKKKDASEIAKMAASLGY